MLMLKLTRQLYTISFSFLLISNPTQCDLTNPKTNAQGNPSENSYANNKIKKQKGQYDTINLAFPHHGHGLPRARLFGPQSTRLQGP